MPQSLRQRLAITAESSRPWPARPVPIALVITDLDVGGAERALVMLATRLDPRRWQPHVFCLDRPGHLADVLRAAAIPCECLDVSRWNPAQVVARLARALNRVKPCLVQSFLFHANQAARLAAPGWLPLGLGGVFGSPSIRKSGTCLSIA